eukprot:TRINITY_DN8117_c0_g1_i4.p1 TRINITY_DN8117_c0_g1~~TRINITY_DN8117_c0_g1_i4.p1  ORF type:complete len:803 (+),score=155.59 TRINITY_DN8117_c0_g1_i4:76-2484(+)
MDEKIENSDVCQIYLDACREGGISPNSALTTILRECNDVHQLKIINLQNAYLCDRGLKCGLLPVLFHLPCLQALNLNNNGLRTEGIVALCGFLKEGSNLQSTAAACLTSLDVSDNPGIAKTGGDSIIHMLRRNRNIVELNVQGTRLELNQIKAIEFLLESHRDVEADDPKLQEIWAEFFLRKEDYVQAFKMVDSELNCHVSDAQFFQALSQVHPRLSFQQQQLILYTTQPDTFGNINWPDFLNRFQIADNQYRPPGPKYFARKITKAIFKLRKILNDEFSFRDPEQKSNISKDVFVSTLRQFLDISLSPIDIIALLRQTNVDAAGMLSYKDFLSRYTVAAPPHDTRTAEILEPLAICVYEKQDIIRRACYDRDVEEAGSLCCAEFRDVLYSLREEAQAVDALSHGSDVARAYLQNLAQQTSSPPGSTPAAPAPAPSSATSALKKLFTFRDEKDNKDATENKLNKENSLRPTALAPSGNSFSQRSNMSIQAEITISQWTNADIDTLVQSSAQAAYTLAPTPAQLHRIKTQKAKRKQTNTAPAETDEKWQLFKKAETSRPRVEKDDPLENVFFDYNAWLSTFRVTVGASRLAGAVPENPPDSLDAADLKDKDFEKNEKGDEGGVGGESRHVLLEMLWEHRKELEEYFKSFDKNNTGFISSEEFFISLHRLRLGLSVRQIKSLYRKCQQLQAPPKPNQPPPPERGASLLPHPPVTSRAPSSRPMPASLARKVTSDRKDEAPLDGPPEEKKGEEDAGGDRSDKIDCQVFLTQLFHIVDLDKEKRQALNKRKVKPFSFAVRPPSVQA